MEELRFAFRPGPAAQPHRRSTERRRVRPAPEGITKKKGRKRGKDDNPSFMSGVGVIALKFLQTSCNVPVAHGFRGNRAAEDEGEGEERWCSRNRAPEAAALERGDAIALLVLSVLCLSALLRWRSKQHGRLGTQQQTGSREKGRKGRVVQENGRES